MNGATARTDANRTLLAALLATVVMLFTAFAAAYLERSTAQQGWSRVPLPPLLWANTLVLALSSAALELGRRAGRRALLGSAMALGLLFLGLQVVAWRELRAAGVFLPSSPHASFLYVLTAVHGLHLLAALAALAAALRRPAILGLCAGFWHFLGLIWLYVLLILEVL
jgi:cytochrome c oxidase subunit 3